MISMVVWNYAPYDWDHSTSLPEKKSRAMCELATRAFYVLHLSWCSMNPNPHVRIGRVTPQLRFLAIASCRD